MLFLVLSSEDTNETFKYILEYNVFIILTGGFTVGFKNKKIFKILFREKPAMMLVELRNAKSEVYASSLAKNVDCTYSHVVKILQEMEKEGLISFNKQGRLKLLALTKKGESVADAIDDIRNSL